MGKPLSPNGLRSLGNRVAVTSGFRSSIPGLHRSRIFCHDVITRLSTLGTGVVPRNSNSMDYKRKTREAGIATDVVSFWVFGCVGNSIGCIMGIGVSR